LDRPDERQFFSMIGMRIREARKEKNITQKQLADLIDINWKYLGSIEHGRQKPSLSKLIQISMALDKSLDYFVKDHPFVYPEYQLNTEIIPKLARCSNRTLKALNTILDILLEIQEPLEKQDNYYE